MDAIQIVIDTLEKIQRYSSGPTCNVALDDTLLDEANHAVQEVSRNLDIVERYIPKKYDINIESIAICRTLLDNIDGSISTNTRFLPYMIKTLEAYQRMGVVVKC